MNSSILAIGYHGCDITTAYDVVLNKGLKPSKNIYDWLGGGVYFWEDDIDRAYEWATYVSQNPKLFHSKITKPCVVGAIIELKNHLDLTIASARNVVKEAYNTLSEIYANAGKELPKNRKAAKGDEYLKIRELDCLVINSINEFRRAKKEPLIDVIRAPFLEGEPLYSGASFMNETHIQICVKNPASIKGYFIPPQYKSMFKSVKSPENWDSTFGEY